MSDEPTSTPGKHAGGRPTKYDPAYCDQIIAFCRDGYSLTAFAGSIGVARETLTKWGEAHPEFLLSLKAAKAGAAYWWEQKGRRVADKGGGPGTATMITFSLKNFAADDYTEKVSHTVGNAPGETFKTEEVSARELLAGKLSRLTGAGRATGSSSEPE